MDCAALIDMSIGLFGTFVLEFIPPHFNECANGRHDNVGDY